MLFNIHEEGRISIKRLTNADLSRSQSSHQTHIGLSDDSLTFIPDGKTEYFAMLIYKDYCEILSAVVGKIQNPNGTFRSPSIKSSSSSGESVVKKIREIASKNPTKDYYMIWFGLDSTQPVFWLIESGSEDFVKMDPLCHFAENPRLHTLDTSTIAFRSILQHTQEKLGEVAVNLQKELEIAAETEQIEPKFKTADVKKAASYIQKIGRQGEELINAYLDQQKHAGIVSTYEWANKSAEQGNPYDFHIEFANGTAHWIDVKTTQHEFEQSVIISRNEMRFITSLKHNEYAIYRVYDLQELSAKLKICLDCYRYITKMERDIDYITQTMKDYQAQLTSYKVAFTPGIHAFQTISEESILK